MLASRFIGRAQEKVLEQYGHLEKRFRLERETFRSKWGKGIGERHTLRGEYRGYPLSLYSHYQKKENGKRQEWTSLVFEALFAEDLDFDIVFENSQVGSLFASRPLEHRLEVGEGVTFFINRSKSDETLITESLRERLQRFAEMPTCGSTRLSKGFLEYREDGLMTRDAIRMRFQDAILLLGDLADSVSIYMVQEKK